MKILFIDTVHPFLQEALVKEGHECTDGHAFNLVELIKIISGFQGVVVRSRIVFDRILIDCATGLRFIARAGAGMESIDVDYAAAKGIVCLNSPEGNRDAVGEHALGMLLSLLNNLNRADQSVKNGEWIREGNRGHELKGKTVALIGYGNMGRSFAEKLRGFDCNVIAYDKYKNGFSDELVEEAAMDQIFLEADALSLHIPLTTETDYLVDENYLDKFRKNIYLINTARGKCVNTVDLVKSLSSGKVSGACLDVLEYEDTSFEKFSIHNSSFEKSDSWQYLVNSDRVILSPHIAGWTIESHERISKILYEKIKNLNYKS